ncbi:DUF302 domain-containing protein [Octadecabacter sp. CECT 8868]|uniref:DUF302 domain-containing protein n=1 Tax=Octadecabacter algicola TaxID=2909342 RepID=UPI001F3C659A|nr:DUF302 domain-containing protein [Octadecabacter algicola]MCF2904386.1 DUF302 domain-containing protein [Octadecabacter algicola]
MKNYVLTTAAVLGLAVQPLMAETVEKTSTLNVEDAMDALENAVTNAGATVFARVDHAQGAVSIEQELPDAQLLIFGNPMIGTPVMQQDLRAGLVLPLHVLIYDNSGVTTIRFEDAGSLFEGLDVAPDAPFIERINGALNGLTNQATGG